MMISPEAYDERNLKGKNEKQLLSAIRGLKNEIGHLKNVMEHPDYGNEPIIHPSESVRISCTREYLAYAIQKLEEMGGTYQPSKAERKVINFQNNLVYVSKITFEMGGFFDGMTKCVLEFNENEVLFTSSKFDLILDEKVIEKDEIMYLLSRLYIGEWKKYYDPKRFRYDVLDGIQWSVIFEYSNGHKKEKFAGRNDYPYNFNEFMDIFCLDNVEIPIIKLKVLRRKGS